MEVEGTALLSREITQLIRDEILGVVRSAKLGQTLEDSVLTALSGPTRVLPEGKTNLCSALTFLSHSSAAQKASCRVVPAIAAMEFLVAAGDVVDDIEDDDVPTP